MRVLYLAAGRDLSARDAGTTHTLNIARALSRLGVEITLASANVPEGLEGIRTVEVVLSKKERIRPSEETLEQLIELVGEFDLIQERAEESGGLGVKLAQYTETCLVLEINTPLSGHPNAFVRKLADWNLRRQARAAAAIITQTPVSRHIIETYSKAPVYVVPNAADPELFNPEAAPAALPSAAARRPVVAFAGSLRPWHGVEDLIAAGAHVMTGHRETFFLFIGGGARLGELMDSAAETLGEGNFHFTGAVAPENVPAYLAAADILVAPFSPQRDRVRKAQFDRYGMWWSPVKIFEYMAMGKPIVASAAGPVAEYISRAGVTVPPGDVIGLAHAISRLLDDPELAATLGGHARRKFLERHTWSHAAQATLAAWKDILEGRQKVSVTR